MDRADRILLRLADPAERAALLTPALGDALLAAAYVFPDRLIGAVDAVRVRRAELLPVHAPERELQLRMADGSSGAPLWEGGGALAASPEPLADGLYELLCTTAQRRVRTTVTDVAVQPLATGLDLAAVDAAIVAADGALPGDPADLETRRQAALVQLVRARMAVPGDLLAADFFAALGAADTAAALDALERGLGTTHLRIALDIDPTGAQSSEDFPLLCAVLVHADPVAELGRILRQARVLQERIDARRVPVPAGAQRRAPAVVLILGPETTLDDDDLPPDPLPPGSGSPAARRAARLHDLNRRLRASGVVCSTLST